ncbi:putative IQ motif, EF-hand binding site [Blattamonas nauphoetae]|uniref:IQ motif, EF-hand binding site n=1 Tax=Blattamonas nauphoetae TaxID=2049346 RepID=A0ABQ9XD88_9EUKA|nr:putative IQ motif, EF-hand binding site [Blattamonas nauphoetae]
MLRIATGDDTGILKSIVYTDKADVVRLSAQFPRHNVLFIDNIPEQDSVYFVIYDVILSETHTRFLGDNFTYKVTTPTKPQQKQQISRILGVVPEDDGKLLSLTYLGVINEVKPSAKCPPHLMKCVLTTTSKGICRFWSLDNDPAVKAEESTEPLLTLQLHADRELTCLRANKDVFAKTGDLFLVGGGIDLNARVWTNPFLDKDSNPKPSWIAKNPPNDKLSLPRSFKITDCQFQNYENGTKWDKIGCITRDAQFVLYDTKQQRRPLVVMDKIGRMALTSLCFCREGFKMESEDTHHSTYVVLGNIVGDVYMVDYTRPQHPIKHFSTAVRQEGAVTATVTEGGMRVRIPSVSSQVIGGITQVLCHPTLDLCVYVGVGRFLVLNEMSGKGECLAKVFLNQKLSSVCLFPSPFDELPLSPSELILRKQTKKKRKTEKLDLNVIESEESGDSQSGEEENESSGSNISASDDSGSGDDGRASSDDSDSTSEDGGSESSSGSLDSDSYASIDSDSEPPKQAPLKQKRSTPALSKQSAKRKTEMRGNKKRPKYESSGDSDSDSSTQEDLQFSVAPVEAIRISACLDEAIEKLAFLNTLTPDVLAHREELANLVGDEISALINEQKALEKEFETLVQQQHELKGVSNITESKNLAQKISQVSSLLQEKTMVLCRNLRDSPNISENITKIQTERSALQSLLQRTTRDLQEFHYITMAKSVLEDKEKQDKLLMAEDNEKKAAAEIAALQQQISQMRSKYDRFEQVLNDSVMKKRQRLKELRKKQPEVAVKQPEAAARLESLKRVLQQEEDEWEEKNRELVSEIENEKRIHEEFLGFLQTKEAELKKLMTNWLLKNEKDTEEISSKLNSVNTKIAATEKVLDDLTNQELAKRIEEEERIEAAKREKEDREREQQRKEARRLTAVLEIQHWIWGKKYAEKSKKKKRGEELGSIPPQQHFSDGTIQVFDPHLKELRCIKPTYLQGFMPSLVDACVFSDGVILVDTDNILYILTEPAGDLSPVNILKIDTDKSFTLTAFTDVNVPNTVFVICATSDLTMHIYIIDTDTLTSKHVKTIFHNEDSTLEQDPPVVVVSKDASRFAVWFKTGLIRIFVSKFLYEPSASPQVPTVSFQLGTIDSLRSIEWCTNNAVLLHLKEEDSTFILLDMNGQTAKLPFSQAFGCVKEVDGVRLITEDGIYFVGEYPSCLRCLTLTPDKHQAAALLIRSFTANQRGETNAYAALLRENHGQLTIAIHDCICAALNITNQNFQSTLLKAASGGLRYLPTNADNVFPYGIGGYESHPIENATREIQIMNSLRRGAVGIGLTYRQYKTFGPKAILNRLVKRGLFSAAIHFSRLSNLDIEPVLDSIALEKIDVMYAQGRSPDEIVQTVMVMVRSNTSHPNLIKTIQRQADLRREGLLEKLVSEHPCTLQLIQLLTSRRFFTIALSTAIHANSVEAVTLILSAIFARVLPEFLSPESTKNFSLTSTEPSKTLSTTVAVLEPYPSLLSAFFFTAHKINKPLFQSLFATSSFSQFAEPERKNVLCVMAAMSNAEEAGIQRYLNKVDKKETVEKAKNARWKQSEIIKYQAELDSRLADKLNLPQYNDVFAAIRRRKQTGIHRRMTTNSFLYLSIVETLDLIVLLDSLQEAEKFAANTGTTARFAALVINQYAKDRSWPKVKEFVDKSKIKREIVVHCLINHKEWSTAMELVQGIKPTIVRGEYAVILAQAASTVTSTAATREVNEYAVAELKKMNKSDREAVKAIHEGKSEMEWIRKNLGE